MKLNKEAAVCAAQIATEPEIVAELALVNQFTKRPLKAEEVYLFAVRLCDNQVDRDGEFFDRATLAQLAPMFVGKSGIFDHSRSAEHQSARLYRTELCVEAGMVAESREVHCYLKGYAYMLRHAGSEGLIAEIDAGIKKEVSVSCAVARQCCSICGAEGLSCGHVKGQSYESGRCAVRLCEATDAYEWSFVAVPAQRAAGVMKALSQDTALEKLFLESGLTVEKLARLQVEAACGRRYLEGLRTEVLRLAGLSQKDLSGTTLTSLVTKLEERELLELKSVYEGTLAKRLPLQTQLCYGETVKQARVDLDGAFCI